MGHQLVTGGGVQEVGDGQHRRVNAVDRWQRGLMGVGGGTMPKPPGNRQKGRGRDRTDGSGTLTAGRGPQQEGARSRHPTHQVGRMGEWIVWPCVWSGVDCGGRPARPGHHAGAVEVEAAVQEVQRRGQGGLGVPDVAVVGVAGDPCEWQGGVGPRLAPAAGTNIGPCFSPNWPKGRPLGGGGYARGHSGSTGRLIFANCGDGP